MPRSPLETRILQELEEDLSAELLERQGQATSAFAGYPNYIPLPALAIKQIVRAEELF